MGRYYVFDGDSFYTCDTLDEAKAKAEEALYWCRDAAPEGWPPQTENISYGQVIAGVQETMRRTRDETDIGVDSEIDIITDYALIELPDSPPNTQVQP